jgi:hypothetical protein
MVNLRQEIDGIERATQGGAEKPIRKQAIAVARSDGAVYKVDGIPRKHMNGKNLEARSDAPLQPGDLL